MTEYQKKQLRKSRYIPLCCAGKITLLVASQKIGISIRSVSQLKKRYKQEGPKIFQRASIGHPGYNKKYDDKFIDLIISIYHKHYEDAPLAAFWRCLRDYEDISIPLTSLRYILKGKLKTGREYRKKTKVKHESRKERKCTGELVQMDASKHDWFLNGTYTNLHGAIDDATHIVTGLYFCDNECRLGYNEVLRQTFNNYGVMQSVYIDRHSSFVTTPSNKSLEERLSFEKNSQTHFTDLCSRLNIEIILALSAEGKGRIERLWQTLQNNLPFIFRRLGIADNQTANRFLQSWLPRFNAEFSIRASSPLSRWKPLPRSFNPDLSLSIKINKRTDQWGVFLFHDHYFELCSPRKSCVHFTLCLSEQYGLKGFYQGSFYDVKLCDNIVTDVIGDKMPQVEKDLIARYLLNDLHSNVV